MCMLIRLNSLTTRKIITRNAQRHDYDYVNTSDSSRLQRPQRSRVTPVQRLLLLSLATLVFSYGGFSEWLVSEIGTTQTPIPCGLIRMVLLDYEPRDMFKYQSWDD